MAGAPATRDHRQGYCRIGLSASRKFWTVRLAQLDGKDEAEAPHEARVSDGLAAITMLIPLQLSLVERKRKGLSCPEGKVCEAVRLHSR